MTILLQQRNSCRCLLSCLENQRLSGVLVGLDLSGEFARPVATDFTCCGGTSLFSHEDGSVYRCDLIKRLQAVHRLLASFEAVWGRHLLPTLLTLQLTGDYLKWLGDFSSGAAIRGRCLQGSRERSQPGVVWAIALAAAWRFGLRAHVVTLGSTRPAGYFPKEPAADDQRKLIYLIERVDKLWVPERAFDFETLVGWCDRAGSPLWIEVLSEEKKVLRAGAEAGLGGQFSRKISDLKNKPALSWLQRDCLSRLNGLTDGTAKFRMRPPSVSRSSSLI